MTTPRRKPVKPRKKRETPEQRARRVAEAVGLGFAIGPSSYDGKICVLAPDGSALVQADYYTQALWRALARKMGVRLR